MPSNETTENPYQSVVDEVWASRDVVKTARENLKAAKAANAQTLTDELTAIKDARDALSRVERDLHEREKAAHESRRNADLAAGRAFHEAVGDDYDEVSYY